MRKIFILLFVPILFIGCKRDGAELLFDAEPQERMAQRIAELENKLLEPQNGWKATLNTGTNTSKGAYNFYINFNNDNTCKMQGDQTEETASVWHETTYRIIWAMTASLVFDTFSYITMLQEPSSSYGGTAPHGHRSDIEFEYVRSTADSIFLKGKKYSHELVLTKLSAAEAASLDEGGLLDMRNEVIDYFALYTNAYFQMEGDIKYAVAIDRSGKTLSVTWLDNEGNVKSHTSGFAYSLSGMDIFKPIDMEGTILSKIDFTGATAKMISSAGNYEMKNNPTPILPITTLFGPTGAFNAIVIEGSILPQGISSDFNTLWTNQVSFLAANSSTMEYLRFSLVNSTTARLSLGFRQGSTVYVATVEFSYTYVDGVITLSSTPTLTNGNYDNGWIAAAMRNYFLGGEFQLDYVTSSNPEVVNIAGLYPVSTPSSFFYGRLGKL